MDKSVCHICVKYKKCKIHKETVGQIIVCPQMEKAKRRSKLADKNKGDKKDES